MPQQNAPAITLEHLNEDLHELHDGVLANHCIHYDLLGLSQQLGLFS